MCLLYPRAAIRVIACVLRQFGARAWAASQEFQEEGEEEEGLMWESRWCCHVRSAVAVLSNRGESSERARPSMDLVEKSLRMFYWRNWAWLLRDREEVGKLMM